MRSYCLSLFAFFKNPLREIQERKCKTAHSFNVLSLGRIVERSAICMRIGMKASGIGGQAVIEGIMMRNQEKYAIAVRKPDKEIELVVKEGKLLTQKFKWMNLPVIRGVFNFIDSLVTGISTISYSASFYDDPQEQEDTKADKIGKAVFHDKLESVLMAVTVLGSVLLAIGLFMLLPYFISRLLAAAVASKFVLNLIEGFLRVGIFLLYILLISRLKDIKRTFMYHGAEHKCINCIENGARLTVENVKHSSRLHKRCGTSFLFLVMFISVIFFIFIRVDNTVLQLVLRILMIPVVAGVSYEVIRWAGKNDNGAVNVISKPGMWLQKLTTKEPDEDMIEVAIKAVEAVFDVEAFLKEYYADSEDPEADMEAAESELALTTSFMANEENKSRIIKFEKPEADEEDDGMFFRSDNLSDSFEASDESESTLYDKNAEEASGYDDKTPYDGMDVYEGDDYENAGDWEESEEFTDDYEDRDILADMDEEQPEEVQSVGEEHSDQADNDSQGSIQTEDSKPEEETELDDGFEFLEETDDSVKEETYADDVPVFKHRRTE